jgi:hypothetical protein
VGGPGEGPTIPEVPALAPSPVSLRGAVSIPGMWKPCGPNLRSAARHQLVAPLSATSSSIAGFHLALESRLVRLRQSDGGERGDHAKLPAAGTFRSGAGF